MKIKGAIFDVDGTLLNSMVMWINVCVEFLEKRNILVEEDLAPKIAKMRMKEISEYYNEIYNIGVTEKAFLDEIHSMVEYHYKNDVEVKEGVKEYLDYLKDNNVRMCIATLTDEYLIKSALKRNNLEGYFLEIFTANKVGAGKDNPLIFEKAIELLDTDKEDTYIFEDSLFAIQTAKKAGFNVVGIYDEASSYNSEKVKEEADIYINSFKEMVLF